MLRQLAKSLPYIRRLHSEIGQLKAELRRWRAWKPPGHFYSPIPSLDEVRSGADRIFNLEPPEICGIDLGEDRQLELLRVLAGYHGELPQGWYSPGSARYHYENEYYSWADGIVLFAMLRHIRPQRFVEIGSGFSSAVVLDTNEAFFDGRIECTFIDPYPERLLGLVKDSDKRYTRIHGQPVQEVPLSVFMGLRGGDVLFIDSSHVSKTGSDLNHVLFEIVPRLAPGVWIHFHDIFYPFEYPRVWVEAGIAWNEAYMLRAFLQYNTAFKIEFFTSYLIQRHRGAVEALLPLALNSERESRLLTAAPGSSLWLSKKGV